MKKHFLQKGKDYSLIILILWLLIIVPNSIASSGRTPDGYRVQIFANKSKIEAIKIKSDYEAKYKDEEIKLYIEFIDGWYKVRLGDYKKKEDAKRFCQIVKKRGYPDAWIVFTVIEMMKSNNKHWHC